MGKLLKAEPLAGFSGTFRVPASKPETQRAIVTSALADGTSAIFNDLRCAETDTMKSACRALGAEISEHDGYLRVRGVGGSPRHDGRVIRAAGSGLVFRTMTALASACPTPVVLSGDATLRRRVMSPLFDALAELGADLEPIAGEGRAPVVNRGGGLKGGACTLPGDVSSQFISAILFAAPLAQTPVDITVTGDVYSRSYVEQTLTSLDRAGIEFSASEDCRALHVEPSCYRPRDVTVYEDYTSASYLLAAMALFPGTSVLAGVRAESQQGEFAIIAILRRLGLRVAFDEAASSLVVDNPHGRPRGDIEVDASDCPNIVPTLAAIGAYIDGTMRVTGGRLTRFHKAPRIEAMTQELSRAGVDIEPVYADGVCDGFTVRGKPSYPGGQVFSSRGDHRIFMSLFIAGLRMASANTFSGFEDVRLSFPGFLAEFTRAGAEIGYVNDPEGKTEDDIGN